MTQSALVAGALGFAPRATAAEEPALAADESEALAEQPAEVADEAPAVASDVADVGSVVPGTDEAVALARQHFNRALQHYRHGGYDGAIRELHWAVYLDPAGKDLEYNLAIVYEKRGELDAALLHWQRYLKLEDEPIERERARLAVERLEGAKRRRAATQQQPPVVPCRAHEQLAQCRHERDRAEGSRQAWVAATAVTSGAALLVGAVLGVKALTLDPDGSEASATTSRGELQDRADRAHRYAIAADLALAVGAGAGLAAGVLYFSTPAASEDTAKAWGVSWGGAF